MNGAITDPCDSTTKPPKTAIMTMIGNSQNFLRTRMKAQSSSTKDMGRPQSILVLHRFGRRSGWLTDDPIARRLWITLQPERVFTKSAHHQPDRHHGRKEQKRHHDRIDHLVKHKAEPQPEPVERRESRRPEQGEQKRHCRRSEPRPARA